MTAGGDLAQIAAELEQLPGRAVRYAVAELRRPLAAQLRRDSGGDSRLSGLHGAGRMTVQTDVTGKGPAVIGTVSAGPPRQRGPWSWLNDGTRPRQQGATGRHPGTPAKHTWSAVVDRTIPTVEQGMASLFDRATR